MKKYALGILFFFAPLTVYADNADFLLSLSGDWKAKTGDSLEWAAPVVDESGWADISLPSVNFLTNYSKELFNQEKPRSKTFIWFRKTFTMETQPQGMVYLQIGEIQNADEVYLNGIRIGSTGSFPPNFHSGWRNFRNYSIDPKLFKQGRNTLALRVFSDVENWIVEPIQLTNNSQSNFEKMMHDFWRINIFEYFFVLLIWVTIYFLIYYFKRPKEIEYLYFSLTCLSMAFIVVAWFYDTKYPFIPIRSNSIYSLCQSALFFFPSFLSLFVCTYINKTASIRRIILTLLPPAVGSLFLLYSTDRSWLLSVRSIIVTFQPIFLGVMYFDLYKAVKRKKPHSLKMVLSIVPLTLFSVRDILAFVLGVGANGDAYFVYGIPPFFLLFAIQFIEQFVTTLNQTEKLKASFYRFVPVEFLKIIGRSNISEVQLGDSTHRTLSVLFTDICQFTKISENMEPNEIFSLLNSYLSHMVPIVQQHNGFVDKYIGDAIMALFPTSPDDAVLAAVSLRKAVRTFNAIQGKTGGIQISSGTGIHFGDLILGTIGGEGRMEGTVVADAVNLASRIESLTRFYGCDILISGSIQTRVNAPENIILRFVDRVAVSGRNSIVELYEVLWDLDETSIKRRAESIRIFEKGTESYFKKDLTNAKNYFNEVMHMDPSDTVAEIYLHRISLIEAGKMEWNDHFVFNQK